ncbi:MAG: hypothetical protein IJQ73_02070 [Kiritimatiellae bacterium]|nr:hypothetical protein [Kiritimatiellia bacterium]
MKRFIFPLVFSVLSAVVFAERIAPPVLPVSAFADTEASTNIAIAALNASRSFSVSLSLDASASNCIEVAVGSDAAPANGRLSAAEASLLFGWDRGRWFLDAPGLTNRVEMLPATANARKTMTLRLGIRPNDSIREIHLLDGGVSILPSPLGLALPSAASWDMLRVTTRGCAPPQESLEVRNSPDGTQLIMR